MGRKSSEHHRLPRSRCDEFGLDKDDPRNRIVKEDKSHEAFHILLGNKTPEEAVRYLFLEWFPPKSFFDPEFIKNKHLRAFFDQLWEEKARKEVGLSYFRCQKCGGKMVEIQRLNRIKVFNCEQCGKDECCSCMICLKPARIAIDAELNFNICEHCIDGFIKKTVKLPKKYKSYAHTIWRIWMEQKNNQIDSK